MTIKKMYGITYHNVYFSKYRFDGVGIRLFDIRSNAEKWLIGYFDGENKYAEVKHLIKIKLVKLEIE